MTTTKADRVRITFYRMTQQSQIAGAADGGHMISVIDVRMGLPDGRSIDVPVTVKQPCGSADIEKVHLEVSVPAPIKLPVQFEPFRDAAEAYFRRQIGAQGMGIRLAPGVSNAVMENNSFFGPPMTVTLPAADRGRNTW